MLHKRIAWLVAAIAAAVWLAPNHAAATDIRLVQVDGTQFKITLTDGQVLRSPDLAGAVLTLAIGGVQRRLRIDAVETDPGDPSKGIAPAPSVFLHTISMASADGTWKNICNPGPDGRRQAFPLSGRSRDDATIQPTGSDDFEITCTGGAQGKCVRFGYRPWENAPAGISPHDLYNACVRMVRADYAGDGRGTTRDGMLIDLYDLFGIQPDEPASRMEFEAGWTKDGAVCVRHVRVKDNVSLGALAELPFLKGRVGEICTEEFARAHGAVLFNRSLP